MLFTYVKRTKKNKDKMLVNAQKKDAVLIYSYITQIVSSPG